jgi:uncharacterized protein (DUF1778 family)
MTAAARAWSGAADERQPARGHHHSKSPAIKRLEARTTPENHAYLEHAAAVSGRSVTDLMVAGAMREAQEAIERAQVLRLSRESQIRFAEALLAPQKPNAALLETAEMYDRMVVSDSTDA